ncbi:beta-ketoacyl-[acyl-carrier-protein] synthase family protein [Photobacterium sp. GJ3]|uniref:beta-ketoacyl-[acyl-carrier-protein] synthase family protein n=1 Tax=Photobacterium sp. GJ3 TaxID=2829502 RepID=UPI001B8B1332|nr:beta-ketoacyl-[acyl-carrier-protein] synthase family protein [Photobacterium sp. GJ3]QUJ66790.1 beta-ketoacyl-[acyl-carrier-protein] synthase family protein [Photobacterium sp. GJ3]
MSEAVNFTAKNRAAITGLGLISAGGIGVQENWETACNGISTAQKIPELEGMEVEIGCRIPSFDPDKLLGRSVARRIDRFIQIAMVAYREAISHSGLDPKNWNGKRVGIVVGSSLAGIERFVDEQHVLENEGDRMVSPSTIPGAMMNMVAGQIAIDCHATGPSLIVSTACASGLTALGVGREWINSGQCDVVIAGSSEAPITPLVVASMNRLGALSKHPDHRHASKPFDEERDGFVIAEGAGFFVLEREDSAISRQAEIHAFVDGYGASTDAYHVTTPRPDGEGLSEAIQAALKDAGIEGKDIQHVNAHGTSTRLNDITESGVIAETVGLHPIVTSIKGSIGHSLAAAGAVESVFTVMSLKNSLVPPTVNLQKVDEGIQLDIAMQQPREIKIQHALKVSLGFGGHNAAIVFSNKNS